MRLIGGKDYYDYVTQYGIDRGTVFNRHETSVIGGRDVPLVYSKLFLYDKGQVLDKNLSRIYIYPLLVVVGMDVYPAIRFVHEKKFSMHEAEKDFPDLIVYDYNEAREYALQTLNKESVDRFFPDQKKATRRDRYGDLWWIGGRNFHWFFNQNFKKNTEWIPKGLVIGWVQSSDPRSETDQFRIFINGDFMEKLQFYKIMPAADLWMKISSLVSPKEPEMVELSDNAKIQKAGFDLKASFRKEKKGK